MESTVLVAGTDFSTDKVQTVIVDGAGVVVADVSFNLRDVFGDKYKLTEGGFVRGTGREVRIPYGLLLDGIDHMLKLTAEAIEQAGLQRTQLARMTMSFQQHGMVAWKKGGYELLPHIATDPQRLFTDQFPSLFATDMATSWMDTSSRQFCEQLLGKMLPADWAKISGSAPMASLRFMGPQAGSLFTQNSNVFENTEKFGVLASLGATLLTGRRQGIGIDEASMTLVMNLQTGNWDEKLLKHYPRGLQSRLPPIVPAGLDLGHIWDYWVQRHGFSPKCHINMGFGDNIAADLTADGVKLSLGSSGTVYQDLQAATYDPTFACHVLRNGKGSFMGMFCADACGKLADRVREMHGLSWEEFDRDLSDPQWNSPDQMIFGQDGNIFQAFKDRKDIAPAVTRAIIMNLKRHCAFMGKPSSITATGGFAKPAVAQVAADMWGCTVYLQNKMNRVAYGSAGWSLSQQTREPIHAVALRLCPRGKEIQPNLSHAEFCRVFEQNFQVEFPQ